MATEVQKIDCDYDIEMKNIQKRTLKGPKNYIQIRYVQTKGEEVSKAELDRVEELTRRARKRDNIERATPNTTMNGIRFLLSAENEGKVTKLLVNKEEDLRRKFALEFQEKTAQKVDPNVRVYNDIGVRIPDIMFFDPEPQAPPEQIKAQMESEKNKFMTLLESIIQQMKANDKNFYMKPKYRNCVQESNRPQDVNKNKRLRDYVIINFDKVEWANEFVRLMDGMTFNKFCLRPHIMDNKPR